MKNLKSAILAIFMLIVWSHVASCQLQSVQSTRLKIEPKEHLYHIQFDAPQVNLLFSLPSINGMTSECLKDRYKFKLYGVSVTGKRVSPVVSHIDKSERHIRVVGQSFDINPAIISDINIYFADPVAAITIEAEFNIRPSYLDAIKTSQFFIKEPEGSVLNPSAPDCIEHISIVLDQSYSMKGFELSAVRTVIQNWISKTNREDSDLYISLITFNTRASILFKRLNINDPKSVQKISQLLNKNKSQTSGDRNTDWSAGLEEASSIEADLILFITDSPPNALEGSKVDRSLALSEAVSAADQVKLNGTRIIAVGADMIVEDNAIQWFNFITSDQNAARLIHPSSWDDYDVASLDYVILPDFSDLEYVLDNIENRCNKNSLESVKNSAQNINIFPNPANQNISLTFDKFDHKASYRYEIYTPDGKLVLTSSFNDNTELIQLEGLASSSYIIQLLDQDDTVLFVDNFVKVD